MSYCVLANCEIARTTKMRLPSIAILFACLIAVPIAQVLADNHFEDRRIAIWHGTFDWHWNATTRHGLSFWEVPSLHGQQESG
jgi:hypothetical protein